MNPLPWVEVSKKALEHNVRQFRRVVGKDVEIMAVVKSNAYGHGIVEAARIFARSGADWLGVANDDEATTLVRAGIRTPILILSYFTTQRGQISFLLRKKVRFSVHTLSQAKLLSDAARRAKTNARVHIKVDAGTSRLGFRPESFLENLQTISRLPHLTIEGIFSHFAESERLDQTFTKEQLDRFEHLLAYAEEQGIVPRYRHIACSASTILNPATRLSLVRIGIGLYGLHSVEPDGRRLERRLRTFRLRPALAWKTKVILVKAVRRGETIGYGRTFRARRPMRIGVLPVGYSEGYDRKLSNRGVVLIHGQRRPVVGRVSMNVMTVDVSGKPRVRVGDEVMLIGRQGRTSITADEIAERIGTINYEVITRVNPLIPRRYV